MRDPSLRGSIIISFTSSYEKCEDLEIITDKKYKMHRPLYISWQSEEVDKKLQEEECGWSKTIQPFYYLREKRQDYANIMSWWEEKKNPP